MSIGGSPSDAGGPRPRSSGVGCMLLLVVGILFLYIASQNARRADLQPQVAPLDRTLPPGRVEPMEPMRSGSGRAPMPRQADVPIERQSPKSTTDGDWSIEEVEVDPSTQSDEGVVLVIPPSQAPTPPSSEAKRTEQGDWSIEEVETDGAAKDEGPSVDKQAPKKTEAGDWEIEEVETEPETVPPAR